eukprot:GHVT01068280.1.p2 GENE.GHVT01068280.1~~GHVT01068280.1.p2  ORF type:complete len:179 (+),score=42.67 GHVT01068280.1:797-1333(+)
MPKNLSGPRQKCFAASKGGVVETWLRAFTCRHEAYQEASGDATGCVSWPTVHEGSKEEIAAALAVLPGRPKAIRWDFGQRRFLFRGADGSHSAFSSRRHGGFIPAYLKALVAFHRSFPAGAEPPNAQTFEAPKEKPTRKRVKGQPPMDSSAATVKAEGDHETHTPAKRETIKKEKRKA